MTSIWTAVSDRDWQDSVGMYEEQDEFEEEPDMTAAELQSRVAALKAELRDTEQQLHEAIIAESPVKVGMIFTREKTIGFGQKRRTVRERGQVTSFIKYWGNETGALMTLFNADGSLGKRTARYGREWERA